MDAEAGARILEKAKSAGAELAGFASVKLVGESPSHKLQNMATGLEIRDFAGLDWPETFRPHHSESRVLHFRDN